MVERIYHGTEKEKFTFSSASTHHTHKTLTIPMDHNSSENKETSFEKRQKIEFRTNPIPNSHEMR